MKNTKDKIMIDKKSKAENFPVGSLLIDKKYRKYIHAFYNFARTADDIADNPSLDTQEKKIILRIFSNSLINKYEAPNPAYDLRQMLLSYKPEAMRHCHDLLNAFQQDSAGIQIRSMEALLAYCRLSAASVGRFVLDIHEEDTSLYSYSDALCSVLQILNHIQDMREDYIDLNRIYLPTNWIEEKGAKIESISRHSLTSPLREVVLKLLDEVDVMIAFAEPLKYKIKNRRLQYEISIIWEVARSLSGKLKTHDVLQEKVKLTTLEKIRCIAKGITRILFAKTKDTESQKYVRNLVEGAGTSFYWAMRFLPKNKRHAMYAIYSFCSEIDDIADGHSSIDKKREQLARWKVALDEESDLFVVKELKAVTTEFDLNPDHFHDILKGVSMDLERSMFAPTLPHLMVYAYRVAGAVGLLSLNVFGVDAADSKEFGVRMGEALQLTNILRDLKEDAEDGRLYVPREYLFDAGFEAQDLKKDAMLILEDERFVVAREKMIKLATEKYDFIIPYFKKNKKKNLKSAYLMMQIYYRIFEKLKCRDDYLEPTSLSKFEKIIISLKAYLTYK